MRHFTISIDIAAPPGRVVDVMTDVERWHEWTRSVTSIKRFDKGPFQAGSRMLIRQPKFPPALWRVVSVDPIRGFESISRSPGLRVVARHSVMPIANGTRATLALDLNGVFGGLFGRLTKSITERYLAMEANGLKARSENPEFQVG